MCGRYRTKLTYNILRAVAPFPLVRPSPEAAPNMEPNLDVRPTTQQWVIRQAADGAEAVQMRWGLVPFWHGGKALRDFKLTTFNAKAETVATAASFKGPFARRRCLVAADGWYEWRAENGPKAKKQRYLFTPKDGEPLTFAGLWERCTTADAGEVESFTIVTQPAGAPLNGYHDRAPVVIWSEDRKRWMHVGEDVADLLGPESPDRFDVRPITDAEISAEGA